MAYRTEVLLACDENDAIYVSRLDAFLLDNCRVQLRNVSKHAGGRKRPDSAVFMSVCNYLPKEAFLELVDVLQWTIPARVQLYLRTDKELLFSEYRFINDVLTKTQEVKPTMNDAERIRDEVFPKAAGLLNEAGIPEDKAMSKAAQAMLLACGLQESRFTHRKQIGGPAHGYFQFEKGGGVRGVMRHPSTSKKALHILTKLGYAFDEHTAYEALINDDVLAVCFARLLLWTSPNALPDQNEVEASWEMYADELWRPGKPHRETWDNFYRQAWEMVA